MHPADMQEIKNDIEAVLKRHNAFLADYDIRDDLLLEQIDGVIERAWNRHYEETHV